MKQYRSLYFEDRKEYYRLKALGLAYKIKVLSTNVDKTYYINFEIAESKGYVVGSLSSPKYIPISEGIKIIKANCDDGYTPINFYEAVEYQKQHDTKFVLMREGVDIQEVNLYV